MWNKLFVMALLVSIVFVQAAYAELDFDTELSSDEEATIDCDSFAHQCFEVVLVAAK